MENNEKSPNSSPTQENFSCKVSGCPVSRKYSQIQDPDNHLSPLPESRFAFHFLLQRWALPFFLLLVILFLVYSLAKLHFSTKTTDLSQIRLLCQLIENQFSQPLEDAKNGKTEKVNEIYSTWVTESFSRNNELQLTIVDSNQRLVGGFAINPKFLKNLPEELVLEDSPPFVTATGPILKNKQNLGWFQLIVQTKKENEDLNQLFFLLLTSLTLTLITLIFHKNPMAIACEIQNRVHNSEKQFLFLEKQLEQIHTHCYENHASFSQLSTEAETLVNIFGKTQEEYKSITQLCDQLLASSKKRQEVTVHVQSFLASQNEYFLKIQSVYREILPRISHVQSLCEKGNVLGAKAFVEANRTKTQSKGLLVLSQEIHQVFQVSLEELDLLLHSLDRISEIGDSFCENENSNHRIFDSMAILEQESFSCTENFIFKHQAHINEMRRLFVIIQDLYVKNSEYKGFLEMQKEKFSEILYQTRILREEFQKLQDT